MSFTADVGGQCDLRLMSRGSAGSTHGTANVHPSYALRRLLGRVLHQSRWRLERRMRRSRPHHPVRDRGTYALGRAPSSSSPPAVLGETLTWRAQKKRHGRHGAGRALLFFRGSSRVFVFNSQFRPGYAKGPSSFRTRRREESLGTMIYAANQRSSSIAAGSSPEALFRKRAKAAFRESRSSA